MEKNQLGIHKEYLELELPSSMEDYQLWEAYNERKIIFNDDVDATAVNKIVHWIRKWNEEDERDGIPLQDRHSPEILLTTNGGDVVAGLAVVDAIRASVTPITVTAIGCAASMGVPILACAHYRRAYENTVLLIHDGQFGVQGTANKAKETMRFFERLDEIVRDIVVEHTHITEGMYEEKKDSEWWMIANQEGIELGIVDEIIK